MKAFPKTLNSWKDVVYVVNNYPKAQWQPKLEALIDEEIVKAWYWVKVLDSKEEGITDDTHKVVEQEIQDVTATSGSATSGTSSTTGTGNKKVQYIQYELRYNLQCKLARMKKCTTDADLVAAIAEVQAFLDGNGDGTEAEAATATTTKTTKKSTKSTKTTK